MKAKAYRRKLERMYTDRCDIYTIEDVYDEDTASTIQDRVYLAKNQPCRISQPGLASNNQQDVNIINYESKLFISPDLDIKQGMKIYVDRMNKNYSCGEPFRYSTHQEIKLKRFDYA